MIGRLGEKLYRRRDLEVHDEVVYSLKPTPTRPEVVALAQKIAEALNEQDDLGDVDDLGDSESILLLSKAPVLNLVMLAEALQIDIDKLKSDHAAEVEQLQRRIGDSDA